MENSMALWALPTNSAAARLVEDLHLDGRKDDCTALRCGSDERGKEADEGEEGEIDHGMYGDHFAEKKGGRIVF